MATVSDIIDTPTTKRELDLNYQLTYIDALLDKGPDWNYWSSAASNTISYTFSVSSGNEADKSGQVVFTAAQQIGARTIFNYLQQETGIKFVETTNGNGAQIHLANMNLQGSNVTGLCSWAANYTYSANDTLASYSANAYVYLDNVEFFSENHNLVPGTGGYQTLLHELGHALGLKHPFESQGNPNDVLSDAEDTTINTLMSYDHKGPALSTFSPYDIAALNWLYGRDGLGGALGIGSTTGARYITGSNKNDTLTGTPYNDTFQGNGGNTMIIGGDGTDTAIFNGNRNAFSFNNLADGLLAVAGAAGTTTLQSVELLQFADMTVSRANVVDTFAPAPPVVAIIQNGKLFATTGNTPQFNGSAEANSTVRLYIGEQLIATATTGADGLWSAKSELPFVDGMNYRVTATATDVSGNTSGLSVGMPFHIDATAPSVPTLNVALTAGGSQPVFSGSGEAGTTIDLWRDGDFVKIGTATVGGDGKWVINSQPLPNGAYSVIVTSTDLAGNATAGQQAVPMTIANSSYLAGTNGADTFTMTPGSNAINGGAGIDVAVFSGARADYTIEKKAWGYSVTDRAGETDGLFSVERLKFSDGWKGTDDTSAQIFRLYQAMWGRESDTSGQGYWTFRMDQGASLVQIADEFMDYPEFIVKFGQDVSNEVFIEKLYQNVLNREPDAGGRLYWLGQIDQIGRAETVLGFSESAENQAQLIGVTSGGVNFDPFTPA